MRSMMSGRMFSTSRHFSMRAPHGIRPVRTVKPHSYDAIVMAVAHREVRELGLKKVRSYGKKVHVLYDIKYLFKGDEVDGRL